MTTARQIFHRCRQLGIALHINLRNDRLILKWQDKRHFTPELHEQLLHVKPELLHMLAGNYNRAAYELTIRETKPGSDLRDDLAQQFDERLAICMESRITYGQACRKAYIQIAKHLEQLVAKSA